jgi:gluconate 2-dehydrogenase gamma chain
VGFVLAATARLIPSEGDGPGAIEAHVPVFIDRQLKGYYGNAEIWYMEGPHDPAATPDRGWQSPLNPAQLYRKAIPAFNAACTERFGKEFKACRRAAGRSSDRVAKGRNQAGP